MDEAGDHALIKEGAVWSLDASKNIKKPGTITVRDVRYAPGPSVSLILMVRVCLTFR